MANLQVLLMLGYSIEGSLLCGIFLKCIYEKGKTWAACRHMCYAWKEIAHNLGDEKETSFISISKLVWAIEWVNKATVINLNCKGTFCLLDP